MIGSIQELRAIAALSVAFFHANYLLILLSGGQSPNSFDPLAAGVDLFFVISGFVMVRSSRDLFGEPGARGRFLIRRLARVVPSYWVATLIAATMMNAASGDLLRSLAFIPYENAQGSLTPVHGVGWTLNFEMLFYVVFASCIGLRTTHAVIATSAIILALVASGAVFHPRSSFLRVWTDPIMLEFVFGMWIAMIPRDVQLPPQIRAAVICLSILCIWWLFAPTGMPTKHRVLTWGIPAAAIVVVSIMRLKQDNSGTLFRLGDASYLIYLIHPLYYDAVILWWDHLSQFGPSRVIGVALVLSVVTSIALTRLEKRVTKTTASFLSSIASRDRLVDA